ncbi:Sugar transport protein [Hibiscus syriacus]|uniref:Sugar transport protein n=1 Tax=Hibiscus syriacus TaxID=106335 RepID=A0A6A2Y526_HIBSY|nr:Sugar transport protein [Hibiscus syriacus]
MPPLIENFPTKGLEGAPSRDIGWHFGDPVPNTKGNVVCKLCGKVVKGGITRFKEHIAHKTGEVTPCPNVTAHCLDLCLEDNGKKSSVEKVLEKAKKVTCFIYNHIWTVDLMKKYTHGKQILRPALTRFATHFIQLEEITRQKQDDEMNVYDQSQQQTLSHSSSSATPSQIGDGIDGGGLSPIDDDDRQSVEKEVNQELDQKEKGKIPENILLKVLLPPEDRLLVTLASNALPPMYHPPPPHMYPPPQRSSGDHFQSEIMRKDLIFLIIPLIGETATTPFLRLKDRHP